MRGPSRRTALAWAAGAGAGAALAIGPAAGGSPYAAPLSEDGRSLLGRLAALERRHSARLGIYARDTATGRTVRYRATEGFPVCSVFKTVAVAAVLRDLDRDGEFLAHRVRYTAKDVTDSGYAPVTGRPENLAGGMTVEELCAAAIGQSDNAAANLLLRALGGPTAVTRFCRSVGDGTTRLDRWEPALNSAEPGRTTDTTSPLAIGRTYAHLTLAAALAPEDRERLTGWLLANTTGGEKLRAGLPADWTVAEKTGSGGYGTSHDVGIAWPPGRPPVVMAVLTTKHEPAAPGDSPLIARAAALLATALG
ncbi:class A beta-lactamase [Streptomyces sp. NBC_00536]|uniref:class A beta-lactamase n=1 Tax=Streptomyces sp. NBC_00536 TaxID=2975769 RepID=UPI002E803D52|nr:class A beta-lactamase [Streptomyces sp. NBC_00536]WUC77399.1 class A beta-lactamase [Streptomyces sp. NBC_00536]